jgi:predicted dehydrogenase
LNTDKTNPHRSGGGLRWGVVGTGFIAERMAPMIHEARNAQFRAIASRRLESARAFARQHAVPQAFGDWTEMVAGDDIDAVYVATPTATKEAICLAAATAGKHVLADKPFANLASLLRIAGACRASDVAFMDATRFTHNPRTERIRTVIAEAVGRPWSVASAFQFELSDPANIRLHPELEPYGAIGDIGWYCMRAAVEYLPSDVEIAAVHAALRRDARTGAAIRGGGLIVFDDGAQSTFECGFESGAGIMDLRISGLRGVIKLDDFAIQRPEESPARFEIRQEWEDTRTEEVIVPRPEAVLMFENFAALVDEGPAREASIRRSLRTQAWLDAVWASALQNEAAV